MEKEKKNPNSGENEDVDIVDLEEHARTHGTEAPRAKKYAFRVDKDRVVVDTPIITGREILSEVGKTPEGHKLYQHKRGHQPILVGPDESVNLREKGVERFTTMPKDTTEGRENGHCLHQDFRLPDADETYLNGLGLTWECRKDGVNRWLILNEWVVPTGYNYDKVSMALLIPDSYSDSPLDMVYFREHLARPDGKPIGALSTQVICGAAWQRWSRHRSSANPWRIGIDDVASHLGLVDEWLRREFEK